MEEDVLEVKSASFGRHLASFSSRELYYYTEITCIKIKLCGALMNGGIRRPLSYHYTRVIKHVEVYGENDLTAKLQN